MPAAIVTSDSAFNEVLAVALRRKRVYKLICKIVPVDLYCTGGEDKSVAEANSVPMPSLEVLTLAAVCLIKYSQLN